MNSITSPLVSIVCITYNQAPFIRETIDSFLMQKTKFDFEILIHDDASTDNTADILREYLIKDKRFIAIFQTENKFSKGINPGIEYLFPIARGKYIAVCEGDDYWTDPYKLQKQVEFLEANPDYSLSFHAAEHLNETSGCKKSHRYKCKNGFRSFTIIDVIWKGGGFMTTNSIVFRTEYVSHLPEWVNKAPAGDYALSILLASKGKVGYLDTIMSVYRANVPESWSVRNRTIKNLFLLHIKTIKTLWRFTNSTNNRYFVSIILMNIKICMLFIKGSLGCLIKKLIANDGKYS